MRYESIPLKIKRYLGSLIRFMKEEFGNWAYVILGVLIFFIYKPIFRFFEIISGFLLYTIIGAIALFIGYKIFKKIIK